MDNNFVEMKMKNLFIQAVLSFYHKLVEYIFDDLISKLTAISHTRWLFICILLIAHGRRNNVLELDLSISIPTTQVSNNILNCSAAHFRKYYSKINLFCYEKGTVSNSIRKMKIKLASKTLTPFSSEFGIWNNNKPF